MKRIYLIWILTLSFTLSFAQQMEYSKSWKTVDSFISKGLPQSAIKINDKIYTAAKAENNEQNLIKSIIYKMQLEEHTSEIDSSIKFFEKETNSTKGLARNLMESMLATLYYTYLQNYSWQINERPITNNAPENIDEWDAVKFSETITAHYHLSLKNPELLKSTLIKDYFTLVEPGINTINLRSTFYDLLVNYALSFFTSKQSAFSKIKNPQELSSKKIFDPTPFFIETDFSKHVDSSFLNEIQLYQSWLKIKSEEGGDGFIDAEMSRYNWAVQNFNEEDKTELSEKFLLDLEKRFPNNFLIQSKKLCTISDLLSAKTGKNPSTKYNNILYTPSLLVSAIEIQLKNCPKNTEAYSLLTNLNNQWKTPFVQIQMENTVLPDKPILAKIDFKNISEVKLNIYKFKNVKTEKYINFSKYKSELIKSEIITLPNTNTFLNSSTEVALSSLKPGNYGIQLKDRNNNIIAQTTLTVTNLVFLDVFRNDAYVLHRETGLPIEGATVSVFSKKYNDKKFTQLFTTLSDNNGKVTLKNYNPTHEYGETYISISTKEETYYPVSHWNYNDIETTTYNPYERIILYADRSIYRPGQTIYFKGISFLNKRVNDFELLKNNSVELILRDVNYQEVKKQTFVTNDYGSFSGSFQLPEGLINGQMSLITAHGSLNFRVEEYKRPKFEVTVDDVDTTYQINDMVRVKGKALSYSGASISNAKVKYRVQRVARFPFYWCWRFYGADITSYSREIAHGEITTSDDGSFEIPFVALADKSVNIESEPLFDYTISIDVTDINGETRSATSSTTVGYKPYFVHIISKPKYGYKDKNNLNVVFKNANDKAVKGSSNVSIYALKSPNQWLRKRLWEKPDTLTLSEPVFRKLFPEDEYNDETKPENFIKDELILQKHISNKTEDTLDLNWKSMNGWYVIETNTMFNNKEHINKSFFQVVNLETEKVSNSIIQWHSEQEDYNPGDQATVELKKYVKDNLYILYNNNYTDNIDYSTHLLKNNWTKKFNLNEQNRGGFGMNAFTIYKNRFFTDSKFIDLPWTSKELNISFETFRDKLEPNKPEQWKIKISGANKDKIGSEVLASMYDKSLDQFVPHQWNAFSLYQNQDMPYNINPNYGFSSSQSYIIEQKYPAPVYFQKVYPSFKYLPTSGQIDMLNEEVIAVGGRSIRNKAIKMIESVKKNKAEMNYANPAVSEDLNAQYKIGVDDGNGFLDSIEVQQKSSPKAANSNDIPLRKNLQETAFFYPQLQTDQDGNVIFNFTTPEALTTWKLQVLAHNKDLASGYTEKQVITQKQLMLTPNLPRYLRQGDEVVFSAKIDNLAESIANGSTSLDLIDAVTLENINEKFGIRNNVQSFKTESRKASVVNWNLKIPYSQTNPILYQIRAKSDKHNDGEEGMLPIVTNRMLITESMPMQVKGNGSKVFNFKTFNETYKSTSARPHSYVLEYTGSPIWYAVQALPYLSENPYDCAEQTFSKLYANILGSQIARSNPKIISVIKTWNKTNSEALKSNLQKNQELKSALLEETPWVLEAENETEQKRNIANFFDENLMATNTQSAIDKLNKMQLSTGAFPWFQGDIDNHFISLYIANGIGRLKKMQSIDEASTLYQIGKKTLNYLDHKNIHEFKEFKKNKSSTVESFVVYYLYMRSLYPDVELTGTSKIAHDFFLDKIKQQWLNFSKHDQAKIALILFRNNEEKIAKQVMASLSENAIHHEEKGMYWKEFTASYNWFNAPIEAMATMIEAYDEVALDKTSANELRVWLLKNKQTNNWKTTKATAEACYALLFNNHWIESNPQVQLKVAHNIIDSKNSEAATVYLKQSFSATQINSKFDKITVDVSGKDSADVSWGSAYWQYFEDFDKITAQPNNPLYITKEIYKKENTSNGPVLIQVKTNDKLKIGDKLVVRLVVRTDREMNYIHIKDSRAACTEPTQVLSGYQWQEGLGYYQSTKDISTNFFASTLPKGTYVLTYESFVNQAGVFSAGMASVQCMYAPEFGAHSQGMKIVVDK